MNDVIVFGKLSIVQVIRIPMFNGGTRQSVKTVHAMWGISEADAIDAFAAFKEANPKQEFFARWQADPVDIL